jgi:hypothetical protein
MNAICLVVDRLHVGYVGCYGNSWIETPNFDRLAAEGFLFDQALIESHDLAVQYESFTSGRAGLASAPRADADQLTIVDQLAAAGINTTLITDDPSVAELPWAGQLDDVVHVESRRVIQPADELEETNLARFFAVVGQWLETAEEPFCLWAHTSGLASSWDAPLRLRMKYAERDEASPPESAIVPCCRLVENYDPDELLGFCQAYAGQVSLLDLCVGALAEDLRQSQVRKNTLLSVLSARGFPLGEHRCVGAFDNSLYAELVHVPWILQLPDDCGASDRTQSLVQGRSLAPTLCEWFGLVASGRPGVEQSLLTLARGESASLGDRAIVVVADGSLAIRVPAWYLIKPPGLSDVSSRPHRATPELYAKPDDRWEVNDVANRCPEVVDLLVQMLAGESSGLAGSEAPALPPILLAGLD